MAHQHAISVHHVEIGFAIEAEICDTLIQTGQVVFHSVFNDSHQVFHGDGQMCGAVMLEHRRVDKNIAIQNQAVYIRCFEFFPTGDFDFAVTEIIDRHHNAAGGFIGTFHVSSEDPVAIMIYGDEPFGIGTYALNARPRTATSPRGAEARRGASPTR